MNIKLDKYTEKMKMSIIFSNSFFICSNYLDILKLTRPIYNFIVTQTHYLSFDKKCNRECYKWTHHRERLQARIWVCSVRTLRQIYCEPEWKTFRHLEIFKKSVNVNITGVVFFRGDGLAFFFKETYVINNYFCF